MYNYLGGVNKYHASIFFGYFFPLDFLIYLLTYWKLTAQFPRITTNLCSFAWMAKLLQHFAVSFSLVGFSALSLQNFDSQPNFLK